MPKKYIKIIKQQPLYTLVVPNKAMAFLRVKKINNNYYYYLVKSVRINGKVKQKVVKYIGKSKNLVSIIENAEQKEDR